MVEFDETTKDQFQPDGERKNKPDSLDPGKHPGDPDADPQNLAKDSIAGGGTADQDKKGGESSLGTNVSNASGPVDQTTTRPIGESHDPNDRTKEGGAGPIRQSDAESGVSRR